MRQTSKPPKKPSAEAALRDIRRATRRQFSAEEKIRVVLEGLRGEDSIAELCRREGIATSTRPGSTSTMWCRWPTACARGAEGWDAARREAFANDPAILLPVEARLNRQKGARGPLGWLPPDEGFHCQYLLRFERVMRAHGLRAPEDEARTLEALRAQACG